jgi:hypothetical protein
MTTAKRINRAVAVLKLSERITVLINEAQGIVAAMTTNAAIFPAPAPPLATITAAIADLATAETAALARTKGAAANRNDKKAALVQLLEQERTYVQTVSDANMENGTTTIQNAGMSVRKPVVHGPRVFAAKPGAVSGSVKLVAPSAARRASYEWEYSINGGQAWVSLPVTLQAKTTLSGLAAGTTVMFRYRGVTKTGEGDWSLPTSLMVK